MSANRTSVLNDDLPDLLWMLGGLHIKKTMRNIAKCILLFCGTNIFYMGTKRDLKRSMEHQLSCISFNITVLTVKSQANHTLTIQQHKCLLSIYSLLSTRFK